MVEFIRIISTRDGNHAFAFKRCGRARREYREGRAAGERDFRIVLCRGDETPEPRVRVDSFDPGYPACAIIERLVSHASAVVAAHCHITSLFGDSE